MVQPNKYLKEENLKGKKNIDVFKSVLYLWKQEKGTIRIKKTKNLSEIKTLS